MFTRTSISQSTGKSSDSLKRLREALERADAVVVGAGAGLSSAAGFVYSGERFQSNFADFEKKYGFHDMYSGGFYPFESPEERWAYWSRFIYLNRYCDPPKSTYQNLLALLQGKDYFVLTTNVDHCFQKAGFDKNRLFYTQGDYGLFQCSAPCRQETFDNEEVVRRMLAEQKDMRVPTELLPVCPHCGRPLTTNLRSDDKFVEDEGWHRAAERYENFLRTREGQRILFLELGVGYNTPSHHQVPLLADDGGQSRGGIRLYQRHGDGVSLGDSPAEYLPQRGYRRGSQAVARRWGRKGYTSGKDRRIKRKLPAR